ncbi:hypothetical protein [Chryseobacterium taklimakanense]|uniref:hypothetical protein n=2 Tax=Chryseobacterium taklimakanense TaxID=536441 RepID=UPI000BA4001D|nr:hypothetical protein [Chryseobacterium taklimakanense]
MNSIFLAEFKIILTVTLSPDKRLQRHPFLVAEETSEAAEKDTAESAVPGNGSGMWAGFPGMAHKKS